MGVFFYFRSNPATATGSSTPLLLSMGVFFYFRSNCLKPSP